MICPNCFKLSQQNLAVWLWTPSALENLNFKV